MKSIYAENISPKLRVLLESYGVKSYRPTRGGLIAIRKNGMWMYFGWDKKNDDFIKAGTQNHFTHEDGSNGGGWVRTK